MMTMIQYDTILKKIEEEYKPNEKILAILVTGSVARGDAKVGNDLDILLVTNGEKFNKEYREGEILVEIGTIVFSNALTEIAQNPMQVYMYLDAKAIFDRGEYLKTLQEKSQSVLESYRTKEEEIKAIKKWLTSVVDKITVAEQNNDVHKVSFILSTSLWKIEEALYAINSMPIPASTSALRRITTLKQLPDNFEEMWDKILLGDLGQRTENTLTLIEFIIPKLK